MRQTIIVAAFALIFVGSSGCGDSDEPQNQQSEEIDVNIFGVTDAQNDAPDTGQGDAQEDTAEMDTGEDMLAGDGGDDGGEEDVPSGDTGDDAADQPDTGPFCGDGEANLSEECDYGNDNADTPCQPLLDLYECTSCDTDCNDVRVVRSVAGRVMNMHRYGRAPVRRAVVDWVGEGAVDVDSEGFFELLDLTDGTDVTFAISAPASGDGTTYSSTWVRATAHDGYTSHVVPRLLEGCAVNITYPYDGDVLSVRLRESCPWLQYHASLELPSSGALMDGEVEFEGEALVELIVVPRTPFDGGEADAQWSAALPGDAPIRCEDGALLPVDGAAEVRVTAVDDGRALTLSEEFAGDGAILRIEGIEPSDEKGFSAVPFLRFNPDDWCWEPVDETSGFYSTVDVIWAISHDETEQSRVHELPLYGFGWWMVSTDPDSEIVAATTCLTGTAMLDGEPAPSFQVHVSGHNGIAEDGGSLTGTLHYGSAVTDLDGNFCVTVQAPTVPSSVAVRDVLVSGTWDRVILGTDSVRIEAVTAGDGFTCDSLEFCTDVGDIELALDPGLSCMVGQLEWNCFGGPADNAIVTGPVTLLEGIDHSMPTIDQTYHNYYRAHVTPEEDGSYCVPIPPEGGDFRFQGYGSPTFGATDVMMEACNGSDYFCLFQLNDELFEEAPLTIEAGQPIDVCGGDCVDVTVSTFTCGD